MTRTLSSVAMSTRSPRRAASVPSFEGESDIPLAYRDGPAPAVTVGAGDRTLSSAAMAARSPRRRLA